MKDPVDPTHATSAAFSREPLVRLWAAADIAAATGQAGAQPLGQTHPPVVATNDPRIVARQVALERPDAKIAAYAAATRYVGTPTP